MGEPHLAIPCIAVSCLAIFVRAGTREGSRLARIRGGIALGARPLAVGVWVAPLLRTYNFQDSARSCCTS